MAHGPQPGANNGTIRGEFDSKSGGRKVTRRSNGLRTLTSSRYASFYFHRRQDPDRAVSASSAGESNGWLIRIARKEATESSPWNRFIIII